MESLFFLIPLSIVLLMGGVGLYFWAVKSGQYEDLEREGENILFDDEPTYPVRKNKPSPAAVENESCDNESHL
jgi:cbb3-type cytochrome oxidase maturation protein